MAVRGSAEYTAGADHVNSATKVNKNDPYGKDCRGGHFFFEEWENKNIHIELRGDVKYIQMRRPDNDRPDTDARQCLPVGNADVVQSAAAGSGDDNRGRIQADAAENRR